MYKKKKCLKIFLIFILFLLISPNAFAKDVIKINDLVNNSKDFNGKEVVVEGEAIGDKMVRKQGTWVNILDDSNVIGIWSENNALNEVNTLGNYKKKGDIIRVSGVFNSNCRLHGGEIDIHAGEVKIISLGQNKKLSISKNKVVVMLILLILTSMLSIIYFKKYRSFKK